MKNPEKQKRRKKKYKKPNNTQAHHSQTAGKKNLTKARGKNTLPIEEQR